MRVNPFFPIAVLSCAAALNAQTVEQSLKWARQTIDTYAVTQHIDPPARSSGTKWQVARIDGCTMELTETAHRESPDSVITGEGVFGLSEDKVVSWTFDLANLLPQFVIASTEGGPHVGIFAENGTFHSRTETISRLLKKDGTTMSTSNWSVPGGAPNLWIYFDSPAADNSAIVKKLELDLRDAVYKCTAKAKAH